MDDKKNPIAWLTDAHCIATSSLGASYRTAGVVQSLAIVHRLRTHGFDGSPSREIGARGKFVVEVAEVRKQLEDFGFRAFFVSKNSLFMIHPDGGVVDLDTHDRDSEEPFSVTASEELVAKIEPLLTTWFHDESPPDTDHDSVYALGVTARGANFRRIGPGARELRRINYDEEVLKDFDHVVTELQSPDPGGRLAIVLGDPGGGKTFMMRGIMHAAKRPRYVLVNGHDVKKMTDAAILPALMEFTQEEARGRPVCFIIEDADECLVPRTGERGNMWGDRGNLSLISALLNLSDGIMGSAFDIRVLATTNAKKIEIDEALVRGGRMIQRPGSDHPRASVHIVALDAKKAADIFDSLFEASTKGGAAVMGKSVMGKRMMLSDVYTMARAHGWTSPALAEVTRKTHSGPRAVHRR